MHQSVEGEGYEISDATLAWIQSSAFSVCYLSSPLSNAVLRHLHPRLVMIVVGVILSLAFFVAAQTGWSNIKICHEYF